VTSYSIPKSKLNYSQPSVPMGSASVDSANLRLKILENNCACTQHVQTVFSLIIIPQTILHDKYLLSICLISGAINNLEVI
jgi:hypothetical protein